MQDSTRSSASFGDFSASEIIESIVFALIKILATGSTLKLTGASAILPKVAEPWHAVNFRALYSMVAVIYARSKEWLSPTNGHNVFSTRRLCAHIQLIPG
jgi:hypothetical protein